jgi:hypothetical protein
MNTSQPQLRLATDADSGRSCPYCRFTLKSGVALAVCPACHAPAHADCWTDNGGCAVVRCTGTPLATSPSTIPEPLPAVTRPQPLIVDTAPQTLYQGTPGPNPPGSGRGPGRGLVIALAAVVVAGGALVAAIVATSHHDSPRTTKLHADKGASGSHDTGSQQRAVPAPTQIDAILASYASDYSAHDLSGLGSLFAPGVTRYGDKSGGCGYTYGRSAVLDAYAAQFGAGAGAYRFVDLSPSAIQINGDAATATLGFRIAVPSGTKFGRVSFELSHPSNHWRIQNIRATC